MSNENTQHLNKLKSINQTRLRILERQAATYGSLAVPAHIEIEINELKTTIAEIEAQLGGQGGAQNLNRSQNVVKILFLAANPKGTEPLRLDQEVREIDEALLQKAEFRDKFELKQQWAVRVSDLQAHLLRFQPDIVHFSGHGSSEGKIVLEDNNGNIRTVSEDALSQLFSLLKDNIRCVVLNACYSASQAQAISEHIDCVIGMSKAIGDTAAISFAKSFYQALGFGRSIDTAFKLGVSQIDLEGLNEQDTPKLLSPNIDPQKMVFVV